MNDVALIRKNLFRKRLRALLMIVSILFAFMIFGVLGAFLRAFNAGEDLAQDDRLVTSTRSTSPSRCRSPISAACATSRACARSPTPTGSAATTRTRRTSLCRFAVEPQPISTSSRRTWSSRRRRSAFIAERTGASRARRWRANGAGRSATASRWEQHLHPEERQPHLGRHHRRHRLSAQPAHRHQPPAVPVRLFRRDPQLSARTRSAGCCCRPPRRDERPRRQRDRRDVRQFPYETATDTEKAFNKAFIAQLGNIALIVVLVVGAAFVTILMIVGNTMALSIRERTREIGVLKTLGFPSGASSGSCSANRCCWRCSAAGRHGRGHPGDPGAARVDCQFRARPAVTPDIALRRWR